MIDDATQEELQCEDEANVEQSEHDRERAVDQRPVDDDVNIPEPGAQDGDADRERKEQQQEGYHRAANHVGKGTQVEEQRQKGI